eukprot:TRINITY_DN857_c0_g1_i10.p1 TRINITY_DN857_c0_g1~~TRINITY_DN857_c0_g1_i10.p1  ORF type:complete len:156 (-),score=57.59 TRINITY_DN857_c0_g1_i10:65-487(-)
MGTEKRKGMNMICAAPLLSLVISCANSCICITTPTTTTSATTTTATTVATTTVTTTTAAAGRRKRSTDECAELESLEQTAFQVCQHGLDGFTWEEVLNCEGNFGNLDLPIEMPTEADFNMMDLNNDGVLTMEEWKEVVGC